MKFLLCLSSFLSCASLSRADTLFPNIQDLTILRGAVLVYPFTVEGKEAAGLSLEQFRIISSNTNLFPASSIHLQKTSTNFVLTLVPPSCRNGSSKIRIELTDGGVSRTNEFFVTVTPPGSPSVWLFGPTSASGREDTTILLPLNVYVDPCASQAVLHLTPRSGNIFALTDIPVTVRGQTNITIALQPLPNLFGEADLLLGLEDDLGSYSASSLHVVVSPVNDRPQIAPIPNATLFLPCPLYKPFVPFTISDVDDDAETLTVNAFSSNSNVVRDADIKIARTGTNFLLSIESAAVGTTTIMVAAADPSGNTATQNFSLSFRSPKSTLPVRIAITKLDAGHVGIVISDDPCSLVTIQTSTNMLTWEDRVTLEVAPLSARWIDVTTDQRMYYRYRH
jgi:hypothetical protein